ncbi:MAG: SUMF1/EgtB/PvdO family nonheme iron enzyme [Phycisphaerales bacterium]
MTRCSFAVSAAALACAVASNAHAQGAANNPHLRLTQQYHWTFSEIGDVGNAPATVENWHAGGASTRQAGRVDYRYRISTTEVTWGQYHEFLQAYAPVMPSNFRFGIVGDYIVNGDFDIQPSPIEFVGLSGSVPQYSLDQSRANEPATAGWRFFARMVNWLHNGKKAAGEVVSADFEIGAYDTSTFGRVDEGPFGVPHLTDQDRRSPGARFWIPSGDELLKAMHYDPNKDGQGNAGYWDYGHSSDTVTPGDPAQGGETNAGFGAQWPAGQHRPLDVGSYADAQSPWGLLDGVGGAPEWTEEWDFPSDPFDGLQNDRMIFNSAAFRNVELGRLFPDGIPTWNDESPWFHDATLRLAAAIPAPGGAGVLALGALLTARRRR